jgi:hypothetical protein
MDTFFFADPTLFADPNASPFDVISIDGSPVGGVYSNGLGIPEVAGYFGLPIDWAAVDTINQSTYFSATYVDSVYGPGSYLDSYMSMVQWAGSPL